MGSGPGEKRHPAQHYETIDLHLVLRVEAPHGAVPVEPCRAERRHLRMLFHETDTGSKIIHEPAHTAVIEINQPRVAAVDQQTGRRLMHDAVLGPVSRQRDALLAKMSPPANPIGSLTLDEAVAAPPYLTAVDIHCMPGGYMADLAGPLYDRIVHIYAMAGWGPDNGAMGRTVTDYIRQAHPGLKPARILDMGCGIGNSTLPYADAFPEAEIQAIDVSAPQLRYAHARAEALGKAVHFRQADATATPYPDACFDLIVSHILLHETSAKAIRQVMAEGHRLLRPGGLMLHVDLALYDGMDPFDAFMLDWDTHHNNEPFWGTFRDMDAGALLTQAGFAPEDLVSALVSRTGNAAHVFSEKRDSGGRRYWQIVGAAKPAADAARAA